MNQDLMKKIFFAVAFMFFAIGMAQETTTIYLIRHAEKADNGENPELSEAGKERTKKWGAYFENKNISTYYTTAFKRTILTASLTASYMSALPEPGTSRETRFMTYDPNDFSLKKIAEENTGKSIVVVGHSNTVPKYINDILGKKVYADISEGEYGNLFIIKITGDKITHELIKM